MSSNLRPLVKCGNGQRRCFTDVQYAAELAFSDALCALSWPKTEAAKRLGVALNTVKSWSAGRTTPDPFVLLACPEFSAVWQQAFESRKAELLAQRAA